MQSFIDVSSWWSAGLALAWAATFSGATDCAATRGAERSSAAAAAATATAALTGHPGDGAFHFYALDVGQGDSMLLVAPDGAAMLIDGGGAFAPDDIDPGAMVVAPVLRKLGIERLDMMVMTHAHPDHIRGLLAIAEHWPVDLLVHGGTELDNPDVVALFHAATSRGAHLQTVAGRPRTMVWHGLELRFLHPRSSDGKPYAQQSLNDNSVVLWVSYHGRTVLLSADIETFAENLLAPGLAKVDILKVGHHGGSSSAQPAFLAATHPEHAVVSCGINNIYGVPQPDVVARLDAVGARLWRTDHQGMIHFWTDGQAWRVETAR